MISCAETGISENAHHRIWSLRKRKANQRGGAARYSTLPTGRETRPHFFKCRSLRRANAKWVNNNVARSPSSTKKPCPRFQMFRCYMDWAKLVWRVARQSLLSVEAMPSTCNHGDWPSEITMDGDNYSTDRWKVVLILDSRRSAILGRRRLRRGAYRNGLKQVGRCQLFDFIVEK